MKKRIQSLNEIDNKDIKEQKILDIDFEIDLVDYEGPFDYDAILTKANVKLKLDVIGKFTINNKSYPKVILYDVVKKRNKKDKVSDYINTFLDKKTAEGIAQRIAIMGIQDFYIDVEEHEFIMFLDKAGNDKYLTLKT